MLLPQLSLINSRKIVLASASPRRQELLGKQLGVRFQVVVSSFEETLPKENYKGEQGAARYAVDTAKGKVLDVARVLQKAGPAEVPDLIIGADTVVEHGGDILEKADDEAAAFAMLSKLSGSLHHVHTGVVLALPKVSDPATGASPLLRTFSCTTNVTFDHLDEELIRAYIATGEPFGKAGSYGIQGIAGSFVKGIEGCFYNVVGLPVHRLASEMRALMKDGVLQ